MNVNNMNVNNRTPIRPTNVPNITITGSSTNANSLIKVLPVNEFDKAYKHQFHVVLKKPTNSQHDIMQFMEDGTSNYSFSEKSIFLQQLVNKRIKNDDDSKGGAGSTFKKERSNNRSDLDEVSNYKFTITGKQSKILKTVPQQVNTNSRYFVFIRKNKELFEAHPVANWYKMQPYTKLDVNAIEESERDFGKTKQIFDDQLKKMIREEISDGYNERDNKVRIMAGGDEEASEDESKDVDMLTKRRKQQLFQKLRHGKKEFVEEESDKDDHEGDEVDYMTDSSVDEDHLSAGEQEKLYECVNVDEEEMLTRELELSDQSEDEKDTKKEEKHEEPDEVIVSSDDSSSDDDDDDSDSYDSDKSEPKKTIPKIDTNNNTVSLKRPFDGNSPINNFAKRCRFEDPKQKEIIEEVRKHLTRKPTSAKELFRMLIKKQLLINDELSKKKLLDVFSYLSAKHDMVNGERMMRL